MSGGNGRHAGPGTARRNGNVPAACAVCDADFQRLARRKPPRVEDDWPAVSVVDLFCGFGGMTIGLLEALAEAERRMTIPLAMDENSVAADAYLRNFPDAAVKTAKVEALIDGDLVAPLTSREQRLRKRIGHVSILVGGPPCQGHSDLNNKTRRNDPRNLLYARMARAARVLRPEIVIIENVPQVAHDRGQVVAITSEALEALNYRVHALTLDLRKVGVPQRRKRHLVLAVPATFPSPRAILDELESGCSMDHRTVGWAISDLEDIEPLTGFDRASVPSEENRKRIEKLFDQGIYNLDNADRPSCHRDKEHTYRSMYGRLWWNQPAQTITTGFGSMGQGRYVHPTRHRTLTPHEAARIQTIPDYYVQLGVDEKRGAWAQMIGNAVPPFLTRALAQRLIPYLMPVQAPDSGVEVAKDGRTVRGSNGKVLASVNARTAL